MITLFSLISDTQVSLYSEKAVSADCAQDFQTPRNTAVFTHLVIFFFLMAISSGTETEHPAIAVLQQCCWHPFWQMGAHCPWDHARQLSKQAGIPCIVHCRTGAFCWGKSHPHSKWRLTSCCTLGNNRRLPQISKWWIWPYSSPCSVTNAPSPAGTQQLHTVSQNVSRNGSIPQPGPHHGCELPQEK